MNDTLSNSHGFHPALQKLSSDGFAISKNVTCNGRTFKAVASRTRFELTKFGFAETFFIFEEFDSITEHALRRFSTEAFALAKQSKSIPLPCGLCESVVCFPVATARKVADLVAHSIRTEAAPKHWAAAEVPVIVDVTNHRLFYFEKTPFWGAAYHSGFRKEIEKYFGES